MTTFYTIKDGKIEQSADWKFAEDCLETEKEIVRAWDGALYFEDEVPIKPLENIKNTKIAELKQARDTAEQGGFKYLGKVFDSDATSCQRVSCAAQTAMVCKLNSVPFQITWTCKDNTTIELNENETIGMVPALAEHSNSVHQKYNALKEAVNEAETEEEVEAITWEIEE